ncbi:MAG: NifB/NifX family molybdenum-iron cluster-binding protein [Candidatus Omnitrophota bacterium]
MKICITSQGTDLDALIDARFGRCQYFIVVDTDTLEFESIPNPNINGTGGAGIQSGQLMNEKQVKAVITGNVGPNAFQTLKAGGIEVITGVSCSGREAVDKYRKGEFEAAEDPSVDSHFGVS